jgi:hypothetical protein
LVKPIAEPGTGRLLDPNTAAKDRPQALVDRSDATYVTLVGPHFEEEFDFLETDLIRMEPTRHGT